MRLTRLSYKTLTLFWCGALALGQESPATFRSKVDLVLVPVVVRDRHGHAVGNLTQADFQLFDNDAPQSISSFLSIRRGGAAQDGAPAGTADPSTAAATAGGPEVAASDGGKKRPARNFIYLFDDLNIRFADLARLREAAAGHFRTQFSTGDRAAIFTVTGRNSLEFTSDRDKLEATVSKLRWGTVAGRGGMECPDVSYYVADLVITKADPQVLDALTYHTAECAHVRPEVARELAKAAANREVIIGREDTKLALATLRRAIRRLAGLPGERVIVLASPGFFAQTSEGIRGTAEVLELAAKNGVIIHGLSVRGVIMAEEEMDVTRRVLVGRRPPSASSPPQTWVRYRQESARADGDVMKDLAEGTGGTFYQNNNDLRAGFERLAAVPEFSYVLGFSPAGPKDQGSYHSLKVRLTGANGGTVDARRGYYALPPDAQPRQTTDLADVFFSPEERSDIPVVLQTGYAKPNHAAVAKAYAVARIGVSTLRLEKTGGRSEDAVETVVALFDAQGAYVTDQAEIEHLSLDDEALAKKDPAVTLRWEFPGVKMGDYIVRFVVREPKTGATTIINRALKIL